MFNDEVPDDDGSPVCEEDAAALRKLRDDDASGVLAEHFGKGGEEPRNWRGVTVADGRVTKLGLWKCSSLTELPAAIGKLSALTELDL